MGTKLDLTGRKFGRLTAIRISAKNNQGTYKWLCQCDCGNETIVKAASLMEGNTNSCGCLISESTTKRQTKHGKCKSGEYESWTNMKQRCSNPKNNSSKNYSKRGILVCERWLNSFDNFYKDMGDKPSPKHSLDRIDPNGNYEPSNCRWATIAQQSRNKRNNRWLEHNGAKMILKDWAAQLGVHYMLIHRMLKSKTFAEVVEYYKNKTYG